MGFIIQSLYAQACTQIWKHQALTFIGFVVDKRDLAIDRNFNNNLYMTPTPKDAFKPPPSLIHLYKSLIWTNFGAL